MPIHLFAVRMRAEVRYRPNDFVQELLTEVAAEQPVTESLSMKDVPNMPSLRGPYPQPQPKCWAHVEKRFDRARAVLVLPDMEHRAKDAGIDPELALQIEASGRKR